MGTLYVVATPLGNLEDITLRALRILREVALIATEDTRTTGRLLKHFDISCPMISYYEHNKLARVDRILKALDKGDVALISEAGTPLFSDPGYELVQAVIEKGLPVVPIPGPSAVTAALPASGLPTDRFLFSGFLPRKTGDRRRSLEEVKAHEVTLIFFEAPHRLRATLADMVAVLGGERPIAVCRELTKLHEEIWRGTLAQAHEEWRERPPRGEFTLVVAGAAPEPAWEKSRVEARLAELVETGLSAKDAVKQVTALSNWSRREVYALAQKIIQQRGEKG